MIERFLNIEDIDKILAIEQEVFFDGWNKEQLTSAFNSGRFFAIGCFDDELLISFVSFSLSIDFVDLEDICTLKKYQHKGYAKKLLEKMISFVESKNIKKILLEVRKSNERAIALYNKYGFHQISVRKKYYFDGEDALILCKEI